MLNIHNRRTTSVLLGITFFIGLLFTALFYVGQGTIGISESTTRVYTIELREDGFHPQELTITEGDTVTFRTIRGVSFWPASNLHPTHDVFAEFDPEEPIGQNHSWSFTFNNPGVWKYHDHLSPRTMGTINTLTAMGESAVIDCEHDSTQGNCVEMQIVTALETNGVAAALTELAKLYSNNQNFAGACHGYAHLIGENAYDLFSKGKDVSLTSHTSYCGFGFYHGFMETMILTNGDIEEGRAFCKYVDGQLFDQSAAAATACYHGIGHGAVDGSDSRTWGNVDAMMAPGFALCDAIAETDFERYICATGVYNAIDTLSANPKYGIGALRDDPFAMCSTQPVEFREPCYTNMLPVVLDLTRYDFTRAAQYVEEHIHDPNVPTIDGFTNREMVILSLFHEFIRAHGKKDGYLADGVALCRSLPKHSRLACIQGLSGGHMKYGEPETSHLKALAFCNDVILVTEEKKACYGYLLPRLLNWKSIEDARAICLLVDEEYRDNCVYVEG